VQESAKDTIHFDNRQYNFIRWKADDYGAIVAALKNRIEATIGRDQQNELREKTSNGGFILDESPADLGSRLDR
jgi:hypothetical protein